MKSTDEQRKLADDLTRVLNECLDADALSALDVLDALATAGLALVRDATGLASRTYVNRISQEVNDGSD